MLVNEGVCNVCFIIVLNRINNCSELAIIGQLAMARLSYCSLINTDNSNYYTMVSLAGAGLCVHTLITVDL